MIFDALDLSGAFLIRPERNNDNRGFFARCFCKKEFQQHGLVDDYVQSSISFNEKRGTLRGMHYQSAPYEETKVVRCTKGSIYDVIVDIRNDSATFGQWYGCELNDTNRHMLYVPAGFAHGFITLEDATEVVYQISSYYEAKAAAGFVWSDSSVAIQWPEKVCVISDKDQQLPTLGL